MKFSFKLPTAALLAVFMAIPAMAVAGDNVSSVNKSIRVDENTTKGDIDSVNGSIRIGANAVVESVESVNGSIDISNGVSVNRGVEAVNGAITLNNGGQVGGDVQTVNGSIRVHETSVAGDVETVNGNIRVLEASEVFGNVIVREPKGWNSRRKPVSVEIGENVIVHGNLVFEQPVELNLHDTARVGEIIGDEVEMAGR